MESTLPPEKIIPTVCSTEPSPGAQPEDYIERQFDLELTLLRKEKLFPRPQAIKKLLRLMNKSEIS